MRVTTPTPGAGVGGGIGLLDSKKAEVLADSLEVHIQPVADPSEPAVIETVDVAFERTLMSLQSNPCQPTPWRCNMRI
jgi:hypothetical protein